MALIDPNVWAIYKPFIAFIDVSMFGKILKNSLHIGIEI